MEYYNKIMTYVWLLAGISIFLMTTFMCFADDYRKWVFYYLFSAISFGMYFMKRWMVKRMTKHMEYLQEEKKKNN